MQPENPAQAGDASPIAPPTSPSLSSAFHRHHPQPTPAVPPRQPSPSASNSSPAGTAHGSLRIAIATPSSELGESSRRKEWPVSRHTTAAELKDQLTNGAIGEGEWHRLGMRLVWHGRIIPDEDRLGDLLDPQRTGSDRVYTLHLVARQKGGPRARPAPPLHPTSPVLPDSPSQISIPASSPAPPTLGSQIVRDITHYLFFTARHHLCHLIAEPPMLWNDTTPPPTVTQADAREAIKSVLAVYAQPSEKWGNWEGAFVGDDDTGVEKLWRSAGGREGVIEEVGTLWSSRLGRAWCEGERGEIVAVDLDTATYQLHLPPLHDLSPSQLTHLLIYLRITTLLPILQSCLERSAVPPTPTLTVQPIPRLPPPRLQANLVFRRRFHIILPSGRVLANVVFSAIKLIAMLWMLTQRMRWSDVRLWILCAAAAGWWLGDTLSQFGQERRRFRARFGNNPMAQPNDAVPGGGAPGPNHVPPAAAVEAPVHAARAAQARPANARNQSQGSIYSWLVPLIQLDRDSRLLRLPLTTTHRAMGELDAVMNVADRRRAARMDRQARQEPPWLITYISLPFALWLITLFPQWEAFRARAIRKRERAMRVLVGELSAAQGEPLTPEARDAQPQATRILPEGLTPKARRYYERVMERGEGVDWEEEREAQRALGIPDDDEGDGVRIL